MASPLLIVEPRTTRVDPQIDRGGAGISLLCRIEGLKWGGQGSNSSLNRPVHRFHHPSDISIPSIAYHPIIPSTHTGSHTTMSVPIRRQTRLRKEYLYRKSLEGKEKAAYERKRLIRTALQGACLVMG